MKHSLVVRLFGCGANVNIRLKLRRSRPYLEGEGTTAEPMLVFVMSTTANAVKGPLIILRYIAAFEESPWVGLRNCSPYGREQNHVIAHAPRSIMDSSMLHMFCSLHVAVWLCCMVQTYCKQEHTASPKKWSKLYIQKYLLAQSDKTMRHFCDE